MASACPSPGHKPAPRRSGYGIPAANPPSTPQRCSPGGHGSGSGTLTPDRLWEGTKHTAPQNHTGQLSRIRSWREGLKKVASCPGGPEPPRRWAPEPCEQVLAVPNGRARGGRRLSNTPSCPLVPSGPCSPVRPFLGLSVRNAVCLGATGLVTFSGTDRQTGAL